MDFFGLVSRGLNKFFSLLLEYFLRDKLNINCIYLQVFSKFSYFISFRKTFTQIFERNSPVKAVLFLIKEVVS